VPSSDATDTVAPPRSICRRPDLRNAKARLFAGVVDARATYAPAVL
jgi:hypothetical protein